MILIEHDCMNVAIVKNNEKISFHNLPQTTVVSSTGSLPQGSGHIHLAEVPSKEGTHLAYFGQVSLSHGSW